MNIAIFGSDFSALHRGPEPITPDLFDARAALVSTGVCIKKKQTIGVCRAT
jgi:hypothetical protein